MYVFFVHVLCMYVCVCVHVILYIRMYNYAHVHVHVHHMCVYISVCSRGCLGVPGRLKLSTGHLHLLILLL